MRRLLSVSLAIAMMLALAVPCFADGASGGAWFSEEELKEMEAHNDQMYSTYLKTAEGQAWLATEEGRAWLDTEAGKRTIENYGPINIPEPAANTTGSNNNSSTQTTGIVTSGTGKFTDVPDDAWYATAVNAMADSGILSGYGDGTFRPNQNITVGELSVILWRLCGITDQEDTLGALVNPPRAWDSERHVWREWQPDKNAYGDCTHWAVLYTGSAAACGWINGLTNMENGTATQECNTVATRGQAIDALMDVFDDLKLLDAEIQKNSLNLEIIRTPNPEKDKNPLLPDIYTVTNNYIGDWNEVRNAMNGNVYKNIVAAYNYGVINGVNDTHDCNPNGNITRAELITMIYNTGVSSWPKTLDHKLWS